MGGWRECHTEQEVGGTLDLLEEEEEIITCLKRARAMTNKTLPRGCGRNEQ